MFKRDEVFEMGDKVEELLTKNYTGYTQGLIYEGTDKTDRVIDMHIFKENTEYQMQYVFKEEVEAEIYYNTFIHDLENHNLREIELNSEEKYLLDILVDNREDLSTYSDHIFSFRRLSDEDCIDFDDITSLEYDKETKIMKVHERLDNVDIIIDFNKEELRYIPNNTGIELKFEEYLDYLDSERLDEEIKRAKKCIEEKQDNETDIEEYETTDLVEFLDWMEEFNYQPENYEYDLIIKNKNITQVSEEGEYQFCAIKDIVKYYKTVKEDGTILLAIAFKYKYDEEEEHEEVWNISPDAGFEM